MKSKNIIQSLGLAAMMAVSAGAFAHGSDDYRTGPNPQSFNSHPAFQESLRMMKEINDRQDKQLDRILNGLYEKRINPHEFRRLMDEQNGIRKMEHAFLADGLLTFFEFKKIDTALDIASRNIFKENHDSYAHHGSNNWNRSYGLGSQYR